MHDFCKRQEFRAHFQIRSVGGLRVYGKPDMVFFQEKFNRPTRSSEAIAIPDEQNVLGMKGIDHFAVMKLFRRAYKRNLALPRVHRRS
jgi:hypothetical protein